MGSDVYGGTESVPSSRDVKVHRLMCTELIQLVNRVSEIYPEIEAARPRWSSGIEALCLSNNAIIKAKLLLRHCAMSSKLCLECSNQDVGSSSTKIWGEHMFHHLHCCGLQESMNHQRKLLALAVAGANSKVANPLVQEISNWLFGGFA